MPTFSHGQGQNRKRGPKTGPGEKAKRKLDAGVERAKQFDRDIMRYGSPTEIQRLFDDDNQNEPGADDTLADSLTEENRSEELTPQNMSEIPLTDEDDLDDSADATRKRYHAPVETDDTLAAVIPWDWATIAVVGDRAVFRIPDWAQGIADKDLDLGWETYNKIAEWLTRDRQDFLRKPDFLALAGTAANLSPPVPVLQEGLRQALGLRCDVTTFSKHARHCIIVWQNCQLPLEGLWSQEAKLAWCAQAAIRRQKERGYTTKDGDLGRLDIQPPRNTDEKKRLRSEASRGWQLGPLRFAQLLCVLTDCKWRDVLERYGSAIFYKG
jgi:hypothetical protein